MKNRDMTKKLTKLIVNGVEYGFKEAIKPITSAGIYRNAQLGVISLSSDGSTWLTIADKNLGATTVYNDGDTLSQANCGNYYQWGNNYGFPFTGAVTTSSSQVNASTYGPLTYYSSSTFITRSSSSYDWSSNTNNNLWGNTTNTNEARKGPCNEGYHIPSKEENISLKTAMTSLGIDTSNGNCMKTYLKMPYAGNRDCQTSNETYQDYDGRYWASSVDTNVAGASCYRFSSTILNVENQQYRSMGLSIRPFYNTPTAPDSNWTVLYQGTGNAGIYHNATLGLISISSDGTNWITIADKNLGATQVYNDGDTLSEANCGKYYQWGNNYGFAWTGIIPNRSSTQVSTVGYGGIGYYSSSTFITGSLNWSSVTNGNLWGNYGDMITEKGPCGDGYHIPTNTESQSMADMLTAIGITTGPNLSKYMKMPRAGFILYTDAIIYEQNNYGDYWAVNMYNTTQAYRLRMSPTKYNLQTYVSCAQGCLIRPFANTPIQPDSSWEVLYKPQPITAGVYHNATDGLISLSSDGINWITITDKNLGATTVYNEGDTLSEANCGKYYQLGNNYGFPFTGPTSTSTTTVNASTYGPGNYYSNGTFRKNSQVPLDWCVPQNNNLWGDTTDTYEARRGPCPEGYHVPTQTEVSNIKTILDSLSLTAEQKKSALKAAFAGYFDETSASLQFRNTWFMIWTSTSYYNTYGGGFYANPIYGIYSGGDTYNSPKGRACGLNIRPFKNASVTPDSSWEKLY